MINLAKLDPKVHWKEAYAEVEQSARQLLTRYAFQRPEGATTTEVAEALFPPNLLRGPADVAIRERIFRALKALAVHDLADCATRSKPVYHKGLRRMIQPWLWHAPDPLYHTGGERPMEEGDL